jgi:hypothetical protein
MRNAGRMSGVLRKPRVCAAHRPAAAGALHREHLLRGAHHRGSYPQQLAVVGTSRCRRSRKSYLHHAHGAASTNPDFETGPSLSVPGSQSSACRMRCPLAQGQLERGVDARHSHAQPTPTWSGRGSGCRCGRGRGAPNPTTAKLLSPVPKSSDPKWNSRHRFPAVPAHRPDSLKEANLDVRRCPL